MFDMGKCSQSSPNLARLLSVVFGRSEAVGSTKVAQGPGQMEKQCRIKD